MSLSSSTYRYSPPSLPFPTPSLTLPITALTLPFLDLTQPLPVTPSSPQSPSHLCTADCARYF